MPLSLFWLRLQIRLNWKTKSKVKKLEGDAAATSGCFVPPLVLDFE